MTVKTKDSRRYIKMAFLKSNTKDYGSIYARQDLLTVLEIDSGALLHCKTKTVISLF